MIPFCYRLRKEIRFEKRMDSYIVISEIPLNVVRVSERAIQILKLCDGTRTLREIANETHIMEEEQVFKICEYFNKKGILEIEPAQSGDYLPFVTVIIPTKDRQSDIAECLESVFSQDYPKHRIEVIVIDDGSKDGTGNLASMFPCKLLSHQKSRGQSYCRNLGAREANGEILAFLDSDCVAGTTWLKEIVTYFQWDQVGAVGGYVDSYFATSPLDRYEEVYSPLNMGKRVLYDTEADSTFYVPSCNILVRRKAFLETGGFNDNMDLGEDVDFCWRLRKRGYTLLYVPQGSVTHKHRNGLPMLLKRRADYGTSEAVLYNLDLEKKKRFHVPPLAAVTYLLMAISTISFSLWPLLFSFMPAFLDVMKKRRNLKALRIKVKPWHTIFSVIRSHFSFAYFISFHILRYYFIFLSLCGLFYPPLWLFCVLTLIITSAVDYTTKRSGLSYLLFLFYYLLEHSAYQIGVFMGCIRRRSFRSYHPYFTLLKFRG
jgi:mycofactocin system glycosyltransferase